MEKIHGFSHSTAAITSGARMPAVMTRFIFGLARAVAVRCRHEEFRINFGMRCWLGGHGNGQVARVSQATVTALPLLEFEHGFTDRFQASFYLNGRSHQISGGALAEDPERKLHRGLEFDGPRARVKIDPTNLHTWLPVRIGKIRTNGLVDILGDVGSEAPVAPEGAFYSADLREFILPYDVIRRTKSPDDALLDFLGTTYEAAADLGKWDRGSLEHGYEPLMNGRGNR